MENNRYVPLETEIDLIDMIWRMLAQWKAILIVALVFAILVPSAVYVKDSRAYEAMRAEAAKEVEKVANLEEETEKTLKKLTPEDRAEVEQALVNDKILESKQEYLLSSFLVNLNTDEASSLSQGYVFSDIDEWSMQNALISGYSTAFRSDEALTEIMEAMGVDSQLRYIKELITVEGSAELDMAGFVEVTITCPDKTACDAVSEAVDRIMRRANKSLSKTVTGHKVQKIYSESASASPDIAATAKQTAYSDLYNTQVQQRGHIATFTEEQTTAYEEISALQAAAKIIDKTKGNATTNYKSSGAVGAIKSATAKEELPSPDFSLKYAMVGFFLGIMLYIGLYLVWLIFDRRVSSAYTAQTYTKTRLLGSYYFQAKRNKLVAFLFRTKVVTNYRYGKNMNLTVQAGKIADEINAICENKSLREITLLQLFDGDGAATLLTAVAEHIEKPFRIIEAWPEANVKDLADREHVVFFLSGKAKMTTVDSVLSLCADYGIQKNGVVFIGEI